MKTSIDAQIVREFLDAFEAVFHSDWQHTKTMLGIESETEAQKVAAQEVGLETIPFIAEGGTFIDPRVEDEVEDWGNRGRLLAAYRNLRAATPQ